MHVVPDVCGLAASKQPQCFQGLAWPDDMPSMACCSIKSCQLAAVFEPASAPACASLTFDYVIVQHTM
jgi:hypothetical protein